MSDAPSPLERIDAAMARIDAAARSIGRERRALDRRHTALRTRLGEAIKALDELIAREDAR